MNKLPRKPANLLSIVPTSILYTRKLTLERQFFLDGFDSLNADAQRQVTDLVSELKQRH